MHVQRSRSYDNADHDPLIPVTVRILQWVALAGAVFCAISLAVGNSVIPMVNLAIYGAWFIVCVEACEAMIRGWRWGAYLLAGATLFITILDIVRGEATLGGASLGAIILVLVVAYLRDHSQSA